MKMIVVVALALVALASAAPAVEEPVPIIRSDYTHNENGGYDFGFESANGIVRNEQGEVKEALDEENKPHLVVVVRGSYSYTDPDGNVETVNYKADELGFQAEGPSIPKPNSRR